MNQSLSFAFFTLAFFSLFLFGRGSRHGGESTVGKREREKEKEREIVSKIVFFVRFGFLGGVQEREGRCAFVFYPVLFISDTTQNDERKRVLSE